MTGIKQYFCGPDLRTKEPGLMVKWSKALPKFFHCL